MANIQERWNKEGKLISYSIRVHKGRDPVTGKQLKPYTMTWRVPVGWSEKRARKEAERQAILFETKCREGYQLDIRQTFASYAEYVMDLKQRAGLKHLTLQRYQQDLDRILPIIGHLKLNEIRPQHLNQLYAQLLESGMRKNKCRAVARPVLISILDEQKIGSQIRMEDGNRISVIRARQRKPILVQTAEKISNALHLPFHQIFRMEEDKRPLSHQSVMGCHILISTILAEAEREMLIPFNPAHRATPPKVKEESKDCLQIKEIQKILEALNKEPVKWQAIVQLLFVSGCRRGELLGLKWEKIDWENQQICIDCALLYSSERGLFEDKPKTKESIRYLQLPKETMELLEEYRECQKEQKKKYGSRWKNVPYVFTNETGGAMNPSRLGNWLNQFSERYSLPHLNPHLFRHTMTSLLFFHGVDSVSISHRLGHAHVSTTTDIYSHVIQQAEQKISDCVADVLLTVKKDSDC